LTNEDRLIVASFKLPVDVFKDQETGAWKVEVGPVIFFFSLTYIESPLSNNVSF